jgi:hypothetical protein
MFLISHHSCRLSFPLHFASLRLLSFLDALTNCSRPLLYPSPSLPALPLFSCAVALPFASCSLRFTLILYHSSSCGDSSSLVLCISPFAWILVSRCLGFVGYGFHQTHTHYYLSRISLTFSSLTLPRLDIDRSIHTFFILLSHYNGQ